jgi:hypothetical protein
MLYCSGYSVQDYPNMMTVIPNFDQALVCVPTVLGVGCCNHLRRMVYIPLATHCDGVACVAARGQGGGLPRARRGGPARPPRHAL